MCSEKKIADIDAGRSVVVRKGWLYIASLIISSGIIGFLFTVIFWVSGTDNNIAKNFESIIEIEDWRKHHSDNNDEMIFNLSRLLEANGLEWRSLKK